MKDRVITIEDVSEFPMNVSTKNNSSTCLYAKSDVPDLMNCDDKLEVLDVHKDVHELSDKFKD